VNGQERHTTARRVVGAVGFMLAGFPLSLVTFTVMVVFLSVGIGTIPIWLGVGLLGLATFLVPEFAQAHRWLISRTVGVDIPRPQPAAADQALRHRLRAALGDGHTWRQLGYLLLTFPLACVEFALAVAGIVLAPLAIWVLPPIAALHAQLAGAMLGPSRTAEVTERAHQLQASRARGVDAAEAERRRIERDLHDGAQQRLVAVAIGLGRAKSKMDDDPGAARTLIDEAHTDAKLAVAELRDLARGIYPAVLGDRGLDAALSSLAARAPIPVEVTATVEPRPPAAVESTAYFIVGEALTNIAKHAQARAATVRVWRDERLGGDAVVVEITDDGVGGAELVDGGGLAGLADRAATIDGVITVVSPLGGPTVIRADLPCEW